MSIEKIPPGGRRAGRPPRLTHEVVVETALRMVEGGAPDSFTMRSLASELGVGVMTLYNYAANREALLQDVAELAFRRVDEHRTPPADPTWQEQVEEAVRELYTTCRRYPQLALMILSSPQPILRGFRRRERILVALDRAGFDAGDALRSLGALVSYALGFAVAGHSGLRAAPDANDRERDVPQIRSHGDQFPTHLDDAAFEYGLQAMIAGLGSADCSRTDSLHKPID